MIDMVKRNKTMKRRINRTCSRVQPKRGMTIHIHHRVFNVRLHPFDISFVVDIFKGQKFIIYSEAKFARVDLRKSPPEPLTQSTPTTSPFKGSVILILDEVFPPPVLVMR